MKNNYIAFVLERYIATQAFHDLVGSDWIAEERYSEILDQTADHAFGLHDIEIPRGIYRAQTEQIFNDLRAGNGIIFDGDDYTDNWFKFDFGRKQQVINNLLGENIARARVKNLGPESFNRALRKIAEEDGLTLREGSPIEDDLRDRIAPGADRIVSFDHNAPEFLELERDLEAVSEIIRGDNNGAVVPPRERPRILEQFRAARDLIKVDRISTKVMASLVLPTLVYLASKFADEAVGQLAGKLLEALATLFGLG